MNQLVSWQEQQQTHQALWFSENGAPAPKRIQVVDDTLSADQAYRLACEGTALLWRGDFFNARQLLQALARRLERKPAPTSDDPQTAFHLKRKTQVQRTRILGMLLIELESDFSIRLRRAPNVLRACQDVFVAIDQNMLLPLRSLNGLIGAQQWREKGVKLPELAHAIHPHYGVFSPVRGEYLALFAQAPLPALDNAFDIGTGTGVLSILLAERGVQQIVATDIDARALACAAENIGRFGFSEKIVLQETNLFPVGQASLIVCNPPWLPASVNTPIEKAIYDPDHQMLKAFLVQVGAHLKPQGQAWLIMSDLAEHLGLRQQGDLADWIQQAGLVVLQQHKTKPQHKKALDSSDPLAFARQKEITSLWRLARRVF